MPAPFPECRQVGGGHREPIASIGKTKCDPSHVSLERLDALSVTVARSHLQSEGLPLGRSMLGTLFHTIAYLWTSGLLFFGLLPLLSSPEMWTSSPNLMLFISLRRTCINHLPPLDSARNHRPRSVSALFCGGRGCVWEEGSASGREAGGSQLLKES